MSPPKLLTPDDPPPADVHSTATIGASSWSAITPAIGCPRPWISLGLSDDVLSHHVAYDRGARSLAAGLSQRLDAPAVLGGFSRLVIDLNRPPSSANSIPAESDGIPVPGNQGLDDAHRLEPAGPSCSIPYHGAVAAALDRARAEGVTPGGGQRPQRSRPALADGVHRPWQIGLLWRHDDRLVTTAAGARCTRNRGWRWGTTSRYSGHIHEGYTLPHHAEHPGLAHVLLEVRDDQLATDGGVAAVGRPPVRCAGRRAGQNWWPSAETRRPDRGDAMAAEPALTVGVEEEFLLVDRRDG